MHRRKLVIRRLHLWISSVWLLATNFKESPVKQNQQPEAARRPAAKSSTVFYLYSPEGTTSCIANVVSAGYHKFSLPPLI